MKSKGTLHLSGSILGHLENLVHLDMSCNNLGDQGAAYLASSLPSLKNLQVLRLGKNKIGEEGGQRLASTLKTLSSLTEISLDGSHTHN